MDYLQALGAAITFGSALGAIVAAFFAQRQKSLVTLLREGNADYKLRVEQLEKDRDSLANVVQKQAEEIKQLKSEKALPLKELTQLIMTQHSENQESIMELTKAIVSSNKIMSDTRK